METRIFEVKGMHCASCATIITSVVSKLDGVGSVDVNYATEKAKIQYDEEIVSLQGIRDEVSKLGYALASNDATRIGEDHTAHTGAGVSKEKKLEELEVMKAKTQFVLPVALMTFVLMLWDIGAKTLPLVPNLPLPMELFNIISMILATVVLFWIGKPFIDAVVRFLEYRVANMDTLIGIGTVTAYVYSVVITLLPAVRDLLRLPEYTYFDVTIVVIGFVVFGKYLEARSKLETGEAIEKLLGLQAKTALLVRDGKEVEVPVEEVQLGDIVIVKPGAKIPVDGVIIEGRSTIDESMISGESIPVDKKIGDAVIGATINKQGSFRCKATKVGSDTLLAQIVKMVEEAQGSRAPIQALADRVSSVFVPVVLGIAFLTLLVWLTVGSQFLGLSVALSYGILSFVGILVIACPCALGLATPTAIIVGVGKGAEYGILIKNAEALEKLSGVDTVVFDKTGTITKGSPEVTDIILLDQTWTDQTLLAVSASIERPSEHPLAAAIVKKAEEAKLESLPVLEFEALEGVGIRGVVEGKRVYIHKPTSSDRNEPILRLEQEGKTVIVVEVEGKNVGLIALSDTLKADAKHAIDMLHAQGITTILLTGDNRYAAVYMAKHVGIDTVIAEVLPQEKAAKIAELQSRGKKVAMAGDGINDAPALVTADVGIAMATGTDIAIESAHITLLHGDITKLSQAFELSRMTMRTVKQNLFWAFIYNLVGIPIAAGLLYPLWGIVLNPIFAGLAMAGSSVSVVTNSLRLRAKKLGKG